MGSSAEPWTTTLRRLVKTPTFALSVIATLALGVGANTAVFSLVSGVLVDPLPYPDADRIVFVHEDNDGIDMPEGWAAARNYLDWRDRAASFESLGLFRGRSVSITTEVIPEYAYGALVTPEFFDVFGVEPAVGRAFAPEDAEEGAATLVILGHGLWVRGFGADPDLIGREVRIDGSPHTVVGVMPPGFEAHGDWVGRAVQLWRPFVFTENVLDQGRSFHVAGRLAEGVDLAAASAEMEALAEDLTALRPEENLEWYVRLDPYRDLMVGDVAAELWLLLGITGLILLIACANVANLSLNRVLDRREELAARRALGATSGSIVRLVLRESSLLALGGGVAGLGLAHGMLQAAKALEPGRIPRIADVGIDARVLLFSLAAVTVAALVFGSLSALSAARGGPSRVLRSARTRGPAGARVRDALVGLQLVLSFALLFGAGLLGRSFAGLRSTDLGFDPEGVVAATVALSWSRISTIEERTRFSDEVLRTLRAEPGIESVGMINSLPLSGSDQTQQVQIDGVTESGREPAVALRGISPGYFETMRIPVQSGRPFNDDDVDNPSVVIVNRTFVERFLPDVDPLGALIRFGQDESWRTIIGVTGDVRHYGPDRDVRPEVYAPYSVEYLTSKTYVARLGGALIDVERRLPEVISRIDPDQPVREVRTMDTWATNATAAARFTAAAGLLGAVLATVLAAVGLFGVLSENVRARRRELAMRIALGARRRGVLSLVARRAVGLILVGLVGGALLAAVLGDALQGFLVGVQVTDPFVGLVAAVVFAVVGTIAAGLPARRATRLDPAEVLREGA